MSLARKATIFGVAWFLLYILAYFVFLAPKFLENHPKSSANAPPQPKRVVNTIHDPYVPEECQLDSFVGNGKEIDSVGIIMVIHDENPLVILRTIRSIIENSQDIHLTIVIIDDFSVSPVKEWTEWSTIDTTVTILRTSKYRGISESRNLGLHQLKEKSVKTVVFLEVGAIVSDNWLWPLLQTMSNHPKSVVYPAVDLLEDHTGKIYPSDNAVATFDWSLKLNWEVITLNSPSRMPLLPSPPISRVEPLLSPALPPTYATSVDFLLELGGLATTSLLSPWGADNIELALRVWLCTDGLIIRQPCSRIAMRRCVDEDETNRKFEICPDSGTQTGYTQLEGDRDAMSLADLWLVTREHKDTVYKHRMLGRYPSQITLREDARHPEFLNTAKLIDVNKCNNFDWFLQQVFPGLNQDKVELLKSYERSTSASKIQEDLSPILSQYQHRTPLFSESRGNIIRAPESSAVEASLKQQEESRKEEIVKNRVRDEYLCLNVNDQKCAESKRAGECTSNIGKTMFTCPKECGFCSPQNELCIDFFLMKCPKQAAEGQCTNEETKTWMSQNCRRSCHLCRQTGDPPLPNEKSTESKVIEVVKEIEHPKETTAEEKEQYLLQNLVRIDPYVSQRQWAAGTLPDPEGTPCSLAGTDHAKLLNYIHVEPDPPMDGVGVAVTPDPNRNGNRIFCAVYTMEANHNTNIQMMKSTWAKRCDGWVAFSTKTDESIPAIEIHHEGPEAYNNMWQKSRSIWKYIAHHYKDEFDWFLIGGDDMYYIVSNLRHFLSSEPVLETRAQQKGMFIGRRFFPPRQVEFNSGGAGYILDRASLQVLADHLDGAPCFPHQVGFWEDVNIANCLLNTHQIKPYDTRDQYGRERFHPFQPANHLLYTVPKNPDWYKLYNPDLKIGLECCAQDSVSFHYAKAPFMQKLHSYLYHCPVKQDLKH